MVRIHRNDAPPRQTVNLVSDEEAEPSNSSPTSSESSSSSSASNDSSTSSSSETEQKPVKPSPVPLSDFIEEDDQPLPNLRSSSSSWEPIKPRRRPLKSLRKKPRLDKIEADDEDSTSSDSTSFEGIPRPEVEADADDEEDQVETTPTRRTPKKRKRPHRAAAPPCFLDAVNKFVEPMSKEAKKYQNLTLSEILYGESDDQDQEWNSYDSSIEYVPSADVVNVGSERTESDESAANDLGSEKNLQLGDSVAPSRKRRRPPKQTRTTSSPPVHISNLMRDKGGNPSAGEDRNSREYTKRPRTSSHSSKRRRHVEAESSSDSPYMEEQEPCSNETQSELNELRKPNNHESTRRHRRNSIQNELQSTPKDDEFGEEVIDLCSGDVCKTPTFEDGDRYAREENALGDGDLDVEHMAQETVSDIAMTDLPRPEQMFVGRDGEDESCFGKDCVSNLEVAESSSFPRNEFDVPNSNGNGRVHDEGVDVGMAKTGGKRESASHPPVHVQEEDTKPFLDDSIRRDSKRKMEVQFQRRYAEAGCDTIKEPNREQTGKREIDIKTVENCKRADLVSKPDPIQTHSRSIRNLCGGTKPVNSKMVRLWPRRRFKGAKPRGNNSHPDVWRKRVPQSQKEIQGWLAFAKAEARDIYRAFTDDEPARRYRCANTDRVFIRQILAELGKQMGLEVCSEKDGDGRRIVFDKSPHESVIGSEEEAEQVVENFFYDALEDLRRGLSKSNKKSGRISEMKDVNEPSKTAANPAVKVQGMGEDGKPYPALVHLGRQKHPKAKMGSRAESTDCQKTAEAKTLVKLLR